MQSGTNRYARMLREYVIALAVVDEVHQVDVHLVAAVACNVERILCFYDEAQRIGQILPESNRHLEAGGQRWQDSIVCDISCGNRVLVVHCALQLTGWLVSFNYSLEDVYIQSKGNSSRQANACKPPSNLLCHSMSGNLQHNRLTYTKIRHSGLHHSLCHYGHSLCRS